MSEINKKIELEIVHVLFLDRAQRTACAYDGITDERSGAVVRYSWA
jgi:hypothetical protein